MSFFNYLVKMTLKVIFGPLLFLLVLREANSVAVICYYASWSASETPPEMFDPNLCTHINYAFAGMWDDGNLKVIDENLEINQGVIRRVTALKQRNPGLKVLLSVGGASDEMKALFKTIASDPNRRGNFVGSASFFMSEYNFDGLDIDWEYPDGGDTGNYINLLRDVSNEFRPRGWLVTAAVASGPTDHGYDVQQMNQYLDIINLMTYDFYGSWSPYTGQNSALFASSVESEWEKSNMNVAAAANNWIQAGIPKNKISVGTAFYGRSFTLADPGQNGLHAPVTGPGPGNDRGYATYSTICTSYNGWTRVWDDEQKNPYRFQGNQWIGYDDKDSIWIKGAWIKSQGFFGAMMWTMDGDDVRGQCGEPQLLLKQLNRSLQ